MKKSVHSYGKKLSMWSSSTRTEHSWVGVCGGGGGGELTLWQILFPCVLRPINSIPISFVIVTLVMYSYE